MSALTLVLKELPGVDADEFRNVRSYYSCGKSYQEALRGESGTRSPLSTGSTKSSSGVSSLSDEETAKPWTTRSGFFTNRRKEEPSRVSQKKWLLTRDSEK